MKKYFFLSLLSLLSLLISFSIIFFGFETFFRIQKNGFIKGIKSWFFIEVPKNNLGSNEFIIEDEKLSYRLNPNLPEINQYSMKNDEIIIPKPNGIKRIAILGDSVSYYGNPNFVDLLKEKFKENKTIEVINASTPGYTTYQEMIFLENYLIKIDPDLVILDYVLNDNHKFLYKFDEKLGILWSNRTEEAEKSLFINNGLDTLVDKSYLLSYLKILLVEKEKQNKLKESEFWWENSVDFNTAWKDSSWPDFEKQLSTMNSLLKKQNSQLLVVIFPIEAQIDSFFLNKDAKYITKPQQKVAYYSNKNKIPYLDLFSSFYYEKNKENSSKIYLDGVHLTKEGHVITAEEIYNFILENL